MSIAIENYLESHKRAVSAFNLRLKKKGVHFSFPENHIPSWLPKSKSDRLFQEFYLATEKSVVRGGYILKNQEFLLDEKVTLIGNYGLPLSEGIIDKQYNYVGLRLLNDALSRQSHIYALGMGGINNPLPQLLNGFGWKLKLIPFYFYVVHPRRFFKQIVALRKDVARSLFADFLAYSGFGWLYLSILQKFKSKFKMSFDHVQDFENFGEWTDNLWSNANSRYSLAAVRSSEFLSLLYSVNDPRFLRLKIQIDNKVVGWTVLLDTQMSKHNYFGNLRVGSIVDCFSEEGYERSVIFAAREFLSRRSVDLIVTNQAHTAWQNGCRLNGLLKGPSNFVLALSPQLWNEIKTRDPNLDFVHFVRGDGDGPINL